MIQRCPNPFCNGGDAVHPRTGRLVSCPACDGSGWLSDNPLINAKRYNALRAVIGEICVQTAAEEANPGRGLGRVPWGDGTVPRADASRVA